MNNIFENIETEKRIELNDRLWQRVEDKLDVNKYKARSNNYRWIAACAILVLAIGFASQYEGTTKRSKYRVTDFSIESIDGMTKQAVDQKSALKKLYDTLLDCTTKGDKYNC